MTTFVLVHGAWHGAWCWYKVVADLQRRGHRVFAPDLPGHGRDRTLSRPPTLADYVERVVRVVKESQQPVVLVGHSMAGGVITAVGEAIPGDLARLVFLCAAIVRNGEAISQVGSGDAGSLLTHYVSVSADRSELLLDPRGLRPLLYADCADEDVALATLLLMPQAIEPTLAPIFFTEDRWGRVPKTYIMCSRDAALSHAWQLEHCASLRCDSILTLDSGHSPFSHSHTNSSVCLTLCRKAGAPRGWEGRSDDVAPLKVRERRDASP